MFSQFTNVQLISAAVILILVIAAAVVGFVDRRGKRTLAFRNRFGSEYDRAVLEHGSSRNAETKLADRETRVDALKIRELGVIERGTIRHRVANRAIPLRRSPQGRGH